MASEAELAVEITHQFVPMIDTLRWRTQAQFHIPGRTPWCELAKPARFRNRPDISALAWNWQSFRVDEDGEGQRAGDRITMGDGGGDGSGGLA